MAALVTARNKKQRERQQGYKFLIPGWALASLRTPLIRRYSQPI
jgi:hypothetical protein